STANQMTRIMFPTRSWLQPIHVKRSAIGTAVSSMNREAAMTVLVRSETQFLEAGGVSMVRPVGWSAWKTRSALSFSPQGAQVILERGDKGLRGQAGRQV